MAKKKNKQKNRQQTSKPKTNKLPMIIIAAVIVAVGGWFAVQAAGPGADDAGSLTASQSLPSVPVTNVNLIETRPLMAPNRVRGAAASVYRWAAEIPGVFDKLYCYCKCKENPRFKHKNLLTCYVDQHASKCNICLKEGQIAWELTKKGMDPKQIQSEIDRYYARLRSSRSF